MDNQRERNCNTCRFGFIIPCDTFKSSEGYQKLAKEGKIDIVKVHELKKNFICDNYDSRYIEYPIEISKINNNFNNNQSSYRNNDIGKFVKIRPCGKEYGNKTYLGIYLGDLPIGAHISYNPEAKELDVSPHSNPAIFVFDLNKIIYGCQSFWGIIENEEDLKDITDGDINNVWYVKALKALRNGD